jgi:hypothetical protein
MPRVGFEPMIPVFERPKMVRALHSTATMIGYRPIQTPDIHKFKNSQDLTKEIRKIFVQLLISVT